MSKIIIVPCSEQGKGGGHLTRCISLTRDLRALGKEARLFIAPQTRDLTPLYKSLNFNPSWCITGAELEIRNNKLGEDIDLIILDNYKTSYEEIIRWKKMSPVIAIDEGGNYRDCFDFLIDILIPKNFIKPAANITSPELLIKDITQRRKDAEDTERKKILISFGQEDTAGLGLKTARTLSKSKNINDFDITLLRGNLNANQFTLPGNIKIINAIPNLSQHLHEYDLVITHYGLTAYEALFAGTKVLLDHPTPYHKKIAKAAGFKTFKNKFFTTNRTFGSSTNLRSEIEAKVRAKTGGSCSSGSWLENKNLIDLINCFNPIVSKHCPVCGENVPIRSITRLCDRTYRKCKKCGIIYMDRINLAPIEYEKEYFFESYLKQYGKTYLDDFENIKHNGKNRLKIIKFLRASVSPCEGISEPTLLDIGCAYGPFLAAAKEEGFSPIGIDPAKDAVQYINEKLGIPAIHSMFPVSDSSFASNSLDVITLWYVLEHFQDCITVFKEIKKLLKPNGILAFSTPSFSGISGRTSLKKFLSVSPADHFTVWSPKTVKKTLAIAGFKVKKIVVVGHHPERFPILGKFANSKKSHAYRLLLAVSKLLGLGDTFEVYAKNIPAKH
ncbi:MAG: methyltransferase domain-containing protein [Treponema sp.]|nr:methyltransferase domain-containing protein [Treponema sp.]